MLTRIAVLVSGGGTNLHALLDAQARGEIRSGRIELVIADRPEAYALKRAAAAGVRTAVVHKKECAGRAQFEALLLQRLEEARIELVVLAGFLQILSAEFVRRYPSRIINVHPSLIPSFCGDGFYGLKVHEEVLRRGVKVTGATVHFVDEGTDTGPIILQQAVCVEQDDTPETLQKRVMEQAEWVIFPKAVALFAAGRLKIEDGRVRILEEESIDEDLSRWKRR